MFTHVYPLMMVSEHPLFLSLDDLPESPLEFQHCKGTEEWW
jgi:hypothetical protein